MSDFRFLHTADIHLDSPMRGLARQEGAAIEHIRTATRQAFDNFVSLALEEKVDFLIIAGDLYDGDWRDYQTGLFFSKQMGRLSTSGIPVYLLYGNHDAESQITRCLNLPNNVNAFASKGPETFEVNGLNIAIHGQSFRQREVTHNLVPFYPEPIPGKFNIGVLHTGLGGMGGHHNYAPCALPELVNKGYDYWALGHVHQASILHERPHVVFPGNLQGRHIKETGPKGAYLITVKDGEITEAQRTYTDVVRWIRLEIPIAACIRLIDVVDRILLAIKNAVAQTADGRLLVCRIELTGQSDLHDSLISSSEHCLAEVQNAILGLGDDVAWVERIVVNTQSLLDSAILCAREDALGKLQRIMNTAKEDAELRDQLEADISVLVHKLPFDIRTNSENVILKAAIDGNYASLIEQVGDYLTSRIMTEEK